MPIIYRGRLKDLDVISFDFGKEIRWLREREGEIVKTVVQVW